MKLPRSQAAGIVLVFLLLLLLMWARYLREFFGW
jgi:hypothetical protein